MSDTYLCDVSDSLLDNFGHRVLHPFWRDQLPKSIGATSRLYVVFKTFDEELEVLLEYWYR